MKLCPECKSDSIEKSYSMALRVVVFIILLFIPFGIFFCWIPFVFPYTYRCKVCGTEVKESELIDIDWREKEAMLEQYKLFEEKLIPFLDKWFIGAGEKVHKIVKANGQFIILRFSDINIHPYRIVDYVNEDGINKFVVKDNIAPEFSVFKNNGIGSYGIQDKEDKKIDDILSSFGQQVISNEEFVKYNSGNENLIKWLKQDRELLENVQIVKETE